MQVLVEWVVRYFSAGHSHPQHTTVDEALRGAHPVTVTDKMPLVLQHKGHSRTIVGYEQTRSGAVNLLQFDPSRCKLLSACIVYQLIRVMRSRLNS